MLTQDYALICEHVRMELGNKFTLIGLLPGTNIGVPMLPFQMPVLTFFHGLRADSTGQFQFTGRLSELGSGKLLGQATGFIQISQPGVVYLPIALGNLRLTAFGSYTWSLEIQGQDEPFITQFDVQHAQMPMRIVPPPR
jgi:hypothetical protein